MLDSAPEATTTAFDDALSNVMGIAEEPQGQPDAALTDEETDQPDTEVETEEEVEAEDSDEQPDADTDTDDDTEETEEAEETETEADSDTATLELDGEEVTLKQVKEWRDREKNLQAGYTKKFQKVAETQKQMDERFETIDAHFQLLENNFKAPLQQFEQVNWQELKTSDPAQYQQLLQQYQATEKGYQQASQARQQLQEKAREAKQAEFQRKAQEAVATLQEQHADWSNELYHQVLDYAAETGVPREEIAQETRPWVISALLNQMRSEKAQQVQAKPKPQSVKKTIKQKAAPKPRTEAQRRADALKSDRAKAARGDRSAQNRVIEAEVLSQLGL